MGTIIRKVFTYLILPACIVGLVYLNVNSIKQPVEFGNEREAREAVAIQRLEDIRELQIAYRNVNGKYASSMDSLVHFYNEGKMVVTLSMGSTDDSLAMANTKALMASREFRGLKGAALNEKLKEAYDRGNTRIVFKVDREVSVCDTIFNSRPDFCIDSLRYIPFSGGDTVIMKSVVRQVQGVDVPLFEACMPYRKLLKGMDNQLRINLDQEQKDKEKYVGLQVGSVTTPNNNAGNWE